MHQIAARVPAEPVVASLFSYCPTMDLVATATEKGSVDVWRLNGQRVFGANFAPNDDEDEPGEGRRDPRGAIQAVGWRRDGQILAVASNDGTVSLINAFMGKIARRFSPSLPAASPSSHATGSQPRASQRRSKSSSTPISHPTQARSPGAWRPTVSTLSWTTHFAYPTSARIRASLNAADSPTILDQILGLRPDVDRLLQLEADLPGELSSIDVEASLPRLATLPPRGVGVDDDVFSSRASVDAIFHGAAGASGSGGVGGVDTLLVGLSDGPRCAVHLRVFDSFEIGTVDVAGVLPSKPEGRVRVLRADSHPFLSTEVLLVEEESGEEGPSVHLLGLDLSFIPRTGRNLPLVARKATQLGNLLRYIWQVQSQLVTEVKAGFDLPAKFLRNVNESLADGGDQDADFVYAAHHLAVTGDCDPRLKEWLVDEVGDRGLKRWEKAVGDCLEVVRRMTSECLHPALERCLVVLSRLDGLARFGPTSSKLGLDEKSLARVRETVDAMGILVEDLLLDVGAEVREFMAFIKWLKWECEVEALEEGSERADELRESWTGEGELKLVLDYVAGAMRESRLRKYLPTEEDEATEEGGLTASFDEDPEMGFYQEYTTRRMASGKTRGRKRMPTLGELLGRVQKQCDAVFGQIADTFRKSILVHYLLELPRQCDASKTLDVRIIPDETVLGLYRLYLLARDRHDRSTLRQVVVTLREDEVGKKGLKHSTSSRTLAVGAEVDGILDAKFVDDGEFLVLATVPGTGVRIFAHKVTTEPDGGGAAWHLRHTFDEGQMDAAAIRPASLEVNGRAGRRAVAVLDAAGLGYVVLDLDADRGEAGQIDDGGDEFMSG